jgi:hypothetical protein
MKQANIGTAGALARFAEYQDVRIYCLNLSELVA